MPPKRILITGMSGLIGAAAGRALAGRYEVTALNRRPIAGARVHLADIADLEAIRPAFANVDVFASSGATIAGYERDAPYAELVSGRAPGDAWPMLTGETPVRPNTIYGASKVWGEALGRYYADAHGLSVVCLRFGSVNDHDRPVTTRERAVWCSLRDAVQGVERAIAAPPELRYAVVHIVSDNRLGYRDLAEARRVLGYVPLDRAEDHRQEERA